MNFLWVETNSRELKPGDTVRVKIDAFTQRELKNIHSGRILEVLYVKDGDVVTKSIDNKIPKLEGSHYSPFHLEKKVLV